MLFVGPLLYLCNTVPDIPIPNVPENKYKEESVTPTFCEKTLNFQFYSLYLSPYC